MDKIINIKVSIIVPSYNSSKTIIETLLSIKNQSFVNFECIIIDDSSKDDSRFKISQFIKNDKRFKLIYLPKNNGVSFARNKGIENSKGEYICFLDSDDLWDINFLRDSFNFMKVNGVEFVYSPYRRFFNFNKTKFFIRMGPKKAIYTNMLLNNHIPLLTAIINRKYIGNIRFVNDRFEDYLFWINILKLNKGLAASRVGDLPLASYRISTSQRSSNKVVNIFRAFRIYNHYLKFSILKAILFTLIFTIYSLYDYFLQYLSFKSESY